MDVSEAIDLAIEGNRLFRISNFTESVSYFEAALRCGTIELKTLSAIYSQLGIANFYLDNYQKAMDYHFLALSVRRSLGDKMGESKTNGNLGNTLKVMGRLDEALVFYKKQLDISRELFDKVLEFRALYNFGNLYQTKGKRLIRIEIEYPGYLNHETKHCFEQSLQYYEQSLCLMRDMEDKSAQGRVVGNLGYIHYLMGNFTEAIKFHEERLGIAKEFGDKVAERRAHCNLGIANTFLDRFEAAIDNYKQTVLLSKSLNDRVSEANGYYSLGITYALLHDYNNAIEYHLRHLMLAQELRESIGEGRVDAIVDIISIIDNQAFTYTKKQFEE